MVARANESVGYAGVQTQDLMQSFGLNSTPGTRANTMRKAIGLDATRLPGSLGSPRYLTGALRQSIIAHRDQALKPV
jgi:hypothetical protein